MYLPRREPKSDRHDSKRCPRRKETRKFYEEHGQSKKLYEHPEKFPHNAIIVESGAYSGRDIGVFFENAEKRRIDTSNMNFLLFEPMAKPFKELERKYRNHRNVQLFKTALGEKRGVMCSTLKGDAVVVSRCDHSSNAHGKITVQDVADYINETVFLYHINCEGCEVPLINRALSRQRLPQNIEVQFHPQHVHPDIYCDIARRLHDSGYRIVYRYAYVWELWSLVEDELF